MLSVAIDVSYREGVIVFIHDFNNERTLPLRAYL
ncbi:MAG: hypothetical protein RL156_1135 [Bacteroidota bacterium]|jgi:hypothetical protein